MQIIVWGLENEFNEMLWNMVASNKGLSKCHDKVKLIMFVNDVVKVDLNQMDKGYTDKFIDTDFIGYCAGFMKLCKPHIQIFLNRHKLTTPWTFNFEFIYSHHKFDARVYFN